MKPAECNVGNLTAGNIEIFGFPIKNGYFFGHQSSRERISSVVNEDFQEFVDLTKRLRRECSWDPEQTHASLPPNLIEEAYEVVESIEHENLAELKNELGDILLHVVFHSNIGEEEGAFTLADVIAGISDKLIRRHPHVFAGAIVSGSQEVKKNWEKLKMSEGREPHLEGLLKE